MRAQRILHLGKFFAPHPGGMETYLEQVVAEQQRTGLDVRVLVHGSPLPNDPPWLVRVPVLAQPAQVVVAPGFVRALARQIKEFAPDVLHLHVPNLSAFAVLLLPAARRLACIVHWHSDIVAPHQFSPLRWLYPFYAPLERALLAHAQRVIATSPPYLQASAPLQEVLDRVAVLP